MAERSVRLAVLTHGYAPRLGGIERQRAAVTPRLAQQGFEAVVITRGVAGAPRRERRHGVDILRIPAIGERWAQGPLRTLGRALDSLLYMGVGLAELVRRRPDVIHTHEFLSTARLGLLAGRILSVPVIVTAHLSGPNGDVERARSSDRGRRLLTSIRERSALAIAVSGPIDRELTSAGLPPERRRIVANGVDVECFRPAATGAARCALRGELGLPGGELVIFTGRLARQKRLDILLDAWSLVSAHRPTAHLLVLGDGDRSIVSRRLPRVEVRPAVIDVRPYLQAADVFVLPSEAEGMSNALLEAQACGLPAVATAVGAAPDVVVHGRTGLLVPPGDSIALSRALAALLGRPDVRGRMALAARQRMVEEFALERTVDGFVRAYRDVTEEAACLPA